MKINKTQATLCVFYSMEHYWRHNITHPCCNSVFSISNFFYLNKRWRHIETAKHHSVVSQRISLQVLIWSITLHRNARTVKDMAWSDRGLFQAPSSKYVKEMRNATINAVWVEHTIMHSVYWYQPGNIKHHATLHNCHICNIQYFCASFALACQAATNIGNAGFTSYVRIKV